MPFFISAPWNETAHSQCVQQRPAAFQPMHTSVNCQRGCFRATLFDRCLLLTWFFCLGPCSWKSYPWSVVFFVGLSRLYRINYADRLISLIDWSHGNWQGDICCLLWSLFSAFSVFHVHTNCFPLCSLYCFWYIGHIYVVCCFQNVDSYVFYFCVAPTTL